MLQARSNAECDGAILAAVDIAAAPGTPSGRNDVDTCVQLQALGEIHSHKVRMLMRSISELKKKLALATAQGKDHRRSAMIRAMKIRLREQELVIDVVKEELGKKAGMGKEETNDWVIRKTVGGPLRFRPKTREELQNELYQLEKKHRQALEKLKARRTGHDAIKRVCPEAEGRPVQHEEGPQSSTSAIAGGERSVSALGDTPEQSSAELIRLSDALEEADALRVAVRSRDATLQAQGDAMDKLQTENRELRGLREKLCRKERRTSELKRKNAELGEKYTSLLEDYEANQDQMQHLKAQLELRKEKLVAESEAFRVQSLRQAEEVSVLLRREEELTTALEEEAAARGRERRENRQAAMQAKQRADAAEKAQEETARQEKNLREQNAAMIAELQRLGKDAAEAAALRASTQELTRDVKRLTQEGEERQGWLQEARERSARAEEAFQASQATLEQVKASKDSLAREFLEAQESWRQERILRGTEREKLEEEVDARKRLESLLAAEREKEKGLAANAANTPPEAEDISAPVGEDERQNNGECGDKSWSSMDERERTGKERVQGTEITVPAGEPRPSLDKRRAFRLSEPQALIEEMASKLEEQAKHIASLEEEKQAVKLQRTSAIKTVEELQAEMAAMKNKLDTTGQARRGVSGDEDDQADDPLSAQPPARRIRFSVSAEDNERKLRENLAASRASEETALRELEKVRLDLGDAKGSYEEQNARVENLVAENEVDDVGGDDGGNAERRMEYDEREKRVVQSLSWRGSEGVV
ncbi:unnamed protein product [Ascophyllum nodosum]